LRRGSLATFQSCTYTLPLVGTSSRSSSRRNVDLPEPDGPIRNTNSPLCTCTDTLSRAGRVEVRYTFDTCSSRITSGESTSAERVSREGGAWVCAAGGLSLGVRRRRPATWLPGRCGAS
jgi:hypothetical protein